MLRSEMDVPGTVFAISGVPAPRSAGLQLKIHTVPDVKRIPQLAILDPKVVGDMQIVAKVLPFRVNNYVVDQLIDWKCAPEDPIFKLVFPSKEMLDEDSFAEMAHAVRGGGSSQEQYQIASRIRAKLNPHPANQLTLNRPFFEGEQIEGIQHKYSETVLFFPSDGQTCHSYCSFCFRWPQFVGDKDLRIAMTDRVRLVNYLKQNREVSDVLITGGDAFMMKARRLRFFLEPLVESELGHITTIRFGTKALSYWPYRFLTESDADELIEVLQWLIDCGKNVAIMAHYNHWRELIPSIAERAIARLRKIGVVIRTQGPVLRGINDDPEVWTTMWRRQVSLGMVPYYMFLARDTGPKDYFSIPLARAYQIYAKAVRRTSGLARTARGPSMSTSIGKVEIEGIADIARERVFVLRLLQSREPNWSYRPFFAKYDENATWFDQLVPAFGERVFFFQMEEHLRYKDPTAHAS